MLQVKSLMCRSISMHQRRGCCISKVSNPLFVWKSTTNRSSFICKNIEKENQIQTQIPDFCSVLPLAQPKNPLYRDWLLCGWAVGLFCDMSQQEESDLQYSVAHFTSHHEPLLLSPLWFTSPVDECAIILIYSYLSWPACLVGLPVGEIHSLECKRDTWIQWTHHPHHHK